MPRTKGYRSDRLRRRRRSRVERSQAWILYPAGGGGRVRRCARRLVRRRPLLQGRDRGREERLPRGHPAHGARSRPAGRRASRRPGPVRWRSGRVRRAAGRAAGRAERRVRVRGRRHGDRDPVGGPRPRGERADRRRLHGAGLGPGQVGRDQRVAGRSRKPRSGGCERPHADGQRRRGRRHGRSAGRLLGRGDQPARRHGAAGRAGRSPRSRQPRCGRPASAPPSPV